MDGAAKALPPGRFASTLLEPMTDQETLERRAILTHQIESRLRPVCVDWPSDVFNAMVHKLVDITLKHETRLEVNGYDRRSTDRLIDDLRGVIARNEAARKRRDNGA